MKKKLFGIILCATLLFALYGCGKDTVEETIQESAEETDENEVDDNQANTEEKGEAETVGSESVIGKDAQKEIEIDEETREELTTQLLEENEMDTSVLDDTKATRGCTFTLPEGFEESEDMPGMYVTKRYPIDASTIYYIEMKKDISLQLMTEETFLEQAQEQFVKNGEMDVEVSLDSFERLEIDGYPAFRIVCSYTLDGVKFTHLEYVINADKSYIITYSQTNEYDRMEEFEASAATIKLEY
ncbi:MAG: hypothetical protein PUD93_06240 [Lachnospiraceae bacterium]|nr:hypothetical protein [Lachnospiraceae bacterium]